MNKSGLVKAISIKTEGITQKDIASVLDVLPDVIKEIVVSGEKIVLTNFITFEKNDIGEKSGIVGIGNKKGEKWVSPAHSEVKAKLSKTYRQL